MTDMQRWAMGYERGELDIAPDPEGAYVLLADAEAAIAAARADMLAKCIAAVEWSHDHNAEHAQGLWLALTELRALKEKP